MGGILSRPVTATHLQRVRSKAYQIGFAELQGWREQHEDAHTILPEFTNEEGFFAVFDGHSGDQCSMYAASNLHKILLKHMDDERSTDSIVEGFLACDAQMKTHQVPAGTTCISALITPRGSNYLVRLINLGDSRALVIKCREKANPDAGECPVRLSLIEATNDHKPDAPGEKARIVAAKGYVTNEDPPRLDGAMALSRMFGDFEYKNNSTLSVRDQKAIAVPEVYVVNADKGDIVAIACDGIFDVLSNEELIKQIELRWPRGGAPLDLAEISSSIIDKCLELESRDNMSLMLVRLSPDDSVAENHDFDEMVLGSYLRELSGEAQKQDDRVRGPSALHSVLNNSNGDSGVLVDKYHVFFKKSGFSPNPISCLACDRVFRSMFRCPCQKAHYCSPQCQKKDWKDHKKVCPSAPNNKSAPGVKVKPVKSKKL